jgi:hypothetical protein
MRKMLALIAVAVLALTLAGPGASADATDLPRGADTTTPYFTGRTLHLGSVDLTVPGSVGGPNSRFMFVGSSTRGWVVAHRAPGVLELYFLSSSGATRFYAKAYGADTGGAYVRLSDDRTRVLSWVYTGAEAVREGMYAAVIDLNGSTLGHRFIKKYADVRGFSGRRVVMSGSSGPTRIWRLGHKPRVLARRAASFADFERNALALKASHQRWTMSSISRPSRMRWQARFQPVRISPNGRLVVGFSTTRPGRPVEVRRLRGGRLVSTWKGSGITYSDSDLTWESNHAVLGYAALDYSAGTWLVVRCRVRGACERASDTRFGRVQFQFSNRF